MDKLLYTYKASFIALGKTKTQHPGDRIQLEGLLWLPNPLIGEKPEEAVERWLRQLRPHLDLIGLSVQEVPTLSLS